MDVIEKAKIVAISQSRQVLYINWLKTTNSRILLCQQARITDKKEDQQLHREGKLQCMLVHN